MSAAVAALGSSDRSAWSTFSERVAGTNEQIFGAKQQIPHKGQCDKCELGLRANPRRAAVTGSRRSKQN
jgi:hypothetical protein